MNILIGDSFICHVIDGKLLISSVECVYSVKVWLINLKNSCVELNEIIVIIYSNKNGKDLK